MDNHRLQHQLREGQARQNMQGETEELIQQIEEHERRRIEAQQEAEEYIRRRIEAQRETKAIKRQAGSEYVPRRSSDEDCVICTLGLANVLQDMVWCKRTCGPFTASASIIGEQ